MWLLLCLLCLFPTTSAAEKCSIKFVTYGEDTAGGSKVACPQAKHLVDAGQDCLASGCTETTCCKPPQSCGDFFESSEGTGNKAQCEAQHRVSGKCKGIACDANDKHTCCRKKCSLGAIEFGTKLKAGNDFKCAQDSKISADAYCKAAVCEEKTDIGCCQQKCTDGFQQDGGKDADKQTCAFGLGVSSTGHCASKRCDDTDSVTCCDTKCENGFEVHGVKTDKENCPKDLQVHKTAYCTGTSCSGQSSQCCQKMCSAGFKTKGGTGDKIECNEGHKVHATGYCAESSCKDTDSSVCCQQECAKGFKLNGATSDEGNECPKGKEELKVSDSVCAGSPCTETDKTVCCKTKCSDTKLGYKLSNATTVVGDTTYTCKATETVHAEKYCDGMCGAGSSETCCGVQPNNTTATADANSACLAAVVGILIVLSATS